MAGRKKTAPETVEAEVVNEVAVTQPAKMEFRLINPTEDGFLRVIKWNKEELEAAVRQKMASYENPVRCGYKPQRPRPVTYFLPARQYAAGQEGQSRAEWADKGHRGSPEDCQEDYQRALQCVRGGTEGDSGTDPGAGRNH